jgi:hypothetical protein
MILAENGAMNGEDPREMQRRAAASLFAEIALVGR